MCFVCLHRVLWPLNVDTFRYNICSPLPVTTILTIPLCLPSHLNACTSLTWSPCVFGPVTSGLIHLNDFSSPEVLDSGVQTNHLHVYPHARPILASVLKCMIFSSSTPTQILLIWQFSSSPDWLILFFLRNLFEANSKLQCSEDANWQTLQ